MATSLRTLPGAYYLWFIRLFLDAPECAQTMVLRGQEEMDARYSIDSTVRELIAQGRRYRYIRWGVTPDDNFHEGKCG
ncbi:hypothetical protein [Escherichia coli]|uniref:hypothetical protein n=1 Tax=Escherichia coli TaxID=562 RepID=UPI000251168E|nr:hypothetical protein [Escherichia coli]EHW98236.1 hypothetical protein ECDEC10F_1820 [Escherichia coli DEC10F]